MKVTAQKCSCCGLESERLVALRCHDDIGICPGCIRWLRDQAGGLDVTPILPVQDMAASILFYEAAGFSVSEHEPGGGYAFVQHDDESAFDLDRVEGQFNPATNGAGCYVIVPDVEGWHARLAAADLPVTELQDKPWGMSEFTLTDPSGNHLRIGQAR